MILTDDESHRHDRSVDCDIDELEAAARTLAIEPRDLRWTHLSLCVLDAVFSINASYDSHTLPTVTRYARYANLPAVLLPPSRAGDVIGTDQEQRLEELIKQIETCGAEQFTQTVLQNRQRTSSRITSPYKIHAALRYAEILVDHGINAIPAAASLLVDDTRRESVERQLSEVAGHGSQGIRLGYLWMLVGDEQRIKPDRMILGWLARISGGRCRPSVGEARRLVALLAERIGRTPWELDHAIWLAERSYRRR